MVDKAYVQIGNRIRSARKDAGYSQQDMADLLKMSDVGYGSFERGSRQISIVFLLKIAKLLGRSVSWFLGIETGLSEEEDRLLTLWKNAGDLQRKLAIQALKLDKVE